MLFTNPVRHKMVRGTPAHFNSFAVSLSHVPDLRVGDIPAQLDELNAIGP